MTSPQRDGSSLFTRVVREPLDAVVAPLVRDALIHDALGVMGLTAPPIERQALKGFVDGGLKSVLERALGAELGRSVVEEMLRALSNANALPRPPRPSPRIPRPRSGAPGSRPASAPPPASRGASPPPPPPSPPAASGEPSAPPRSRPTPVPYGMRRPTPPPGMIDARSRPPSLPASARESLPPVSGERSRGVRSRPPLPSVALPRAPLVLVGTADRALFDALARCFEDRARVRRVLSAADVVRELDEAGASRKLVVLDAKMPTVRPAALAVLLESMNGVEVVLCRSMPETEERILSVSAASSKWTIYRETAPVDHVAEACIGLVS